MSGSNKVGDSWLNEHSTFTDSGKGSNPRLMLADGKAGALVEIEEGTTESFWNQAARSVKKAE